MKFIIYSPPFTRHCGGIRACHRLGWDLQSLGYNVKMAWTNNTDPERPVPILHGTPDVDSIVVYPEIIPTNPVGLNKRVRWILSPVGQDWIDSLQDDLIMSWGDWYKNIPRLYVPIVDQRYFNLDGVGNRDIVITYKAARIPGDVEIDDYHPETWTELASLFKRAKYLRTGDNNTCVALECRLCGCPVLFTSFDNSSDLNSGMYLGITTNFDEIEMARSRLPEFYSSYEQYKDDSITVVKNFIKICEEKWK